MRRVTSLVVVFFCIAASSGAADEKPKLPLGVPPRLVTVGHVDQKKGEVGLWNHTVCFIWESVQKEVKRDGNTEMATETIRKPIYETQAWTLTLKSAEVFDVQGRKLASDEVWKRVAVGATVAVSADARKVEPAYLAALAKDTLVFVSPEYAVNNVMQIARGAPTLLPVGSPIAPAIK